ncbi:MAG: hypothetical protein ACI841_005477 [Planctomycetota bacterium]
MRMISVTVAATESSRSLAGLREVWKTLDQKQSRFNREPLGRQREGPLGQGPERSGFIGQAVSHRS